MGTLYVDTLEPEGATTSLAVGESGQNMVIGGNTIKFNTLQDAGGNAIFTSDGSGSLSSVNSAFGGMTSLLLTQDASNSAAISFSSTYLTSSYKEYIFRFFNLNPATDNVQFQFQVSTDNGAGYGIEITSTFFTSWHNESDSNQAVSYTSAQSLSTSTDYQTMFWSLGGDADECGIGELHLINPSSTTYVKNFWSRLSGMGDSPMAMDLYMGGYADTTTAINAINFKMSSGNFDGKIKMFGVN